MMPTTTVQSTAQTLDVPEIADPSKVAPKDARGLSKLFFDQLAVLEEGTHEYQDARSTLIEMNMSWSATRPAGSAAVGRRRWRTSSRSA